MNPYQDNVATFRVLLGGYQAAGRRFTEARLGSDPALNFQALFEALNWAVALDDHLRQHWAPGGKPLDWAWRCRIDDGQHVSAVRFARNRVHHQWADTLLLCQGGVAAPFEFPLVTHEGKWRPSADLPCGDDNHGIDDYDRHLADNPARFTIRRIDRVYRRLALLLEPDIASGSAGDE